MDVVFSLMCRQIWEDLKNPVLPRRASGSIAGGKIQLMEQTNPGFDLLPKKTINEAFLDEMNRVIP